MSANITLQLSYDSSFIDFVVNKNNADDPDKITSIDLKLSLLSNGNSYSKESAVNKIDFPLLRDYLLPWKWMENDQPTHIRIYKVNKGSINPPNWIDVKIEEQKVVDSGDLDMIQNYFEESLVSQLQTLDHIMLRINKKEAEIINVDENYTVNTRENKSQAVIAQMAQKLFPFNENLGFLFLVNKELTRDNELQFFQSTDNNEIRFVCFPVASTNDQSIWYPKNNSVNESNGNYWIEYNIPAPLGRNNVSCQAYTKATEYPEDEFEIGNVTLRKNRKFAGKVKIEIEQENNWKIGFTDVLANILDIRDFVFKDFLTKDNIEKMIRDGNFSDNLKMIKKLLFSPFTFIKYGIPFIKNSCLNKIIYEGNQEEYDKATTKAEETFETISKNIDIFHTNENEKESLLQSILEIIPFKYAEDKKYSDNDEINELYDVFQKLSDASVQQTLLNLIFNFDYNTTLKPIKNKGKSYFLESDENKLEIWKKAEGTEVNDQQIETKEIIELYSVNGYDIFFQLLLRQGYTGKGIQTLKYLVEEADSFEAEELTRFIPELIDNVYNDAAATQTVFQFPLTKVETFDIKFKNISDDLLKNSIKNEINVLAEEPETPSTDQLPIRIQIGKPNQLVPKKDEEPDDLADELSGYILLSTRSTKPNDDSSFETWKYHNWAKAKLSTGDNKLNTSFLVPSYLPEQDDVKQLFLEINNESASLVANLEGLSQDDFSAEGGEKDKAPSIDFFLPADDYGNNPYALRYGHYYNFAAFAMMNSGVLPEPLRKDDILNKFNENIEDDDISDLTETFHFLRTKAVSPPSVIIKDPDDKTTVYPKDYPKELNPLYHELFTEDGKHTDLKAPIILGKNFNNNCFIKIKKPRTDFWDCYSFAWPEFNEGNTKPNKYKIKDESKNIEEFLDPSVADNIWMNIEILNDLNSPDSASFVEPSIIKYDTNHEVRLNFKWGEIDSFINNTLTLSQGKIYKISFFNLIDEKYFEFVEKVEDGKLKKVAVNDCLFDPDRTFITDKDTIIIEGTKYYKVSGEYLVFETAFENANTEDLNKELWKALNFSEELSTQAVEMSDSVKLLLNSKNYQSYSRVKVQHQKLDWQGRQPNINLSGPGIDDHPDPDRRNSDGTLSLSKAMELDAWWNSERPHDTSVVSYAKILASKEGKNNLLHEYKNILDNHAMLLKYTASLHNRYESLGPPYAADLITSEIKLDNKEEGNKIGTFYPWKFYLKKSRREERLPAPSVRFYIPLTGSIKEANDTLELNIADVMLVLDEVWYREAGLAQKFKLGIKNTGYKKMKDPEDPESPVEYMKYAEAGFDVTLSKAVTKPHNAIVNGKEESSLIRVDQEFILVEDEYIKGPLGFTFDFVATNPKVNSTSFVISGNGLASYIGDDYKAKNDPFYPMFNLAVRNEISKKLHKIDEDPNYNQEEKEKLIAGMTSKWSGAQWVQFLKAVDSFVPDQWRNDVRKNGFVDISKQPTLKDFEMLGNAFLDYHNCYLILSTIESNIGGLPIESYYDTFRIEDGLKQAHNKDKIEGFEGGYARIMVVRKSKDYKDHTTSIWDELFGKKEKDEKNGEKIKIKNDNILAMPIITERIPVKFK